MTTDYRALCAELADDLQEARDAVSDWASYASEYFKQKHNLQEELDRIQSQIDRARAALTQSVSEKESERITSIATAVQECAMGWAPTTLLIGNVCAEDVVDLCSAVLTRWGRPAVEPVPEGPTYEELVELTDSYGVSVEDIGPLVSTVLARWGRPAVVPVPVAERLPGPTDEDLYDLADDCDLDRFEGERSYPDGVVVKEGCYEAWNHQLVAFARAVLARWGSISVVPQESRDHQLPVFARASRWDSISVVPVPVAEGLPGPRDCDDRWQRHNGEIAAVWLLRRPDDWPTILRPIVWAPHWALPVPQEGADG